MTGYILCATPRSGSTLLCSLLRSSGVAGHPESWFRRQDRADWARDWAILRGDGGFDWDVYLQAAMAAGTGSNRVFGLRLMWNTLGELVADLAGPAVGEQAALLARCFGPLRFIHLSRHDLVAQAVSRHRAEMSGIWHLGIEAGKHPPEPTYDFGRIEGYLRAAEADNAGWDIWFAANGISPLRVSYEDLSADPVAVAQGVLADLGLVAAKPMQSRVRKMADSVSADWALRFRTEAGRRAG